MSPMNETPSLEDISINSNTQLPPPPGRTDLLPLKPRSSFKTLSSNIRRPPLAPVSPTKPSSSARLFPPSPGPPPPPPFPIPPGGTPGSCPLPGVRPGFCPLPPQILPGVRPGPRPPPPQMLPGVRRLETLFFICTLEEDISTTKELFETLEIACKELRNSRLFLKLLEAVLKTGNCVNDGTFRGGAQAFKLDTLLKLSDVKGTDGKTTLLQFVVQEIIRYEGVRAARRNKGSNSFSSLKSEDLLQETLHESDEHYRSLGLEVVSSLGDELDNVKKAANMDADCLTGTVAKISHALQKTKDFLIFDMKNVEEDSGFHDALKKFVKDAEGDIKELLEEEKRIMALAKSTGDYFHGNAGKDEGLRLFSV